MTEAITLITVLALTVLNYRMTRHLVHPAVVYCGIWCIQLVGLLAFSDRFVATENETFLVVLAGCVTFSIGCHLSLSKSPPGGASAVREVREGVPLFALGALLSVGALYGQYTRFEEIGPGADFATRLVLARIQMSIENEDIYGAFKYGVSISIGCLLLLQIIILKGKSRLAHKLLFLLFLVTSLGMSLLSTGRGPVLFVLLLLCVLYVLMRGLVWRTFAIAAFVGVASFGVFWIMGSAMGKADEEAARAVDDLIAYLFSSIPALSQHMKEQPPEFFGGDLGTNTFRFFHALLASLGYAMAPDSLVQEFVNVPHPANLYTIYRQYLDDFGLLGAAMIPLLLGILHGLLFKYALGSRRSSDLAVFALAVSYLPLMQSVFQETHLTGLSTWIQFALIGLMFTTPTVARQGFRYAQRA